MLSTWDDLKKFGYQEQATWCSLWMWQSTKDLKITEYVGNYTQGRKYSLKILHTQNIYS